MSDQAATIDFLGRAESYGERGPIERIETHISIVFLVGDRAFKLKRAVAFSYLDFSTAAARQKNCAAEFRLGRKMAPRLYHALHAVTRAADGSLAFDGAGEAIDTVIEMRRFDQALLFDHLAAQGRLTPDLIHRLADAIAAFHAAADGIAVTDAVPRMSAIIADIGQNLRARGEFNPAAIAALERRLGAALRANAALVARRAAEGKFRRCHGDLHLGNICLLDGEPTLFDPVEFNPAISDIDVLYDIAFTLMDLGHASRIELANRLFNRYFDVTGDDGGMALLPLYLALRAAIRAHVLAGTRLNRAQDYFVLANRLLDPCPPRLVAIGGLSGTGKSTLAQALAPECGRFPGARILRSDAIRKRLHGATLETGLPATAYDPDTSRRVYAILRDEARAALGAGQAVIADATFLEPQEREGIAACADAAKVPFLGLWLEAPVTILEKRLAQRERDISDADVGVLRLQLRRDLGAIDWHRLPADNKTAAAATALLASS